MKTRINQTWDDLRNLPLVLKNSASFFPSLPAVTSVDGTNYNFKELELSARHIAVMLKSAGIGKGDNVAILSENSPHWVIAYFGILATGATTVPILPDFQGPEVLSILEHSEAKSLFVSGKLLSRLTEGLPTAVELVFNTDDFRVLDVIKGKVALTADTPGKLIKLEADSKTLGKGEGLFQAEEDDLASIIYTSGTTGRSKGVMLSHNNILSNAKQSWTIHPVVETDLFLSMLPLAHSYECTIGMVVPLLNGAEVHYIDRAPTASYLKPLLQKVQPTTMLTVPLIIEKIYRASVRPALTKSPAMRMMMKFGITRKLLSKAAAGKLLKFFGGRIRFFGVGGAPFAPDVEKFLIEGKFPYAIGYGLTETSPMISGFGPADAVYRSVGTVMDGITVRIENPDPVTKEGEIVVSGPNIMQGYYKDAEKTLEVFTVDGFFRTGDLGYRDKNGILFIRGRSKNMILGPNGENIYPEEIEAVINSREIVSESLVMEYKGKLVARVHLKLEVMETLEERIKHLKENAAEFQQQMQIKADEMLTELMTQVNQHVARNSKLQDIILQVTPFEKTPTQKIKRFLYNQIAPA
ncbi:MAG: AMP-binding protein [Bacteroidales bacterium]|nr:AMP-binding protein [Bacteroidales bacterium]